MFSSIGGPEIILIFIVALLVFGPKRLPELGKTVGRVLGEIRKATGELRANVEKEIGIDPLDGFRQAGRAWREIMSTLSEPIREVARDALGGVRDVAQQATAGVRGALEAPPGQAPSEDPGGGSVRPEGGSSGGPGGRGEPAEAAADTGGEGRPGAVETATADDSGTVPAAAPATRAGHRGPGK